MNKHFSKLKLKDIVTLVILLCIGFGWLKIDQVFLPEVYQRFIALIIVTLILFFLQFYINKPERVIPYTNSIALITVLIVIIIGVVVHVLLKHDFTFRVVMIWLTTVIIPYISALIYYFVRKK